MNRSTSFTRRRAFRFPGQFARVAMIAFDSARVVGLTTAIPACPFNKGGSDAVNNGRKFKRFASLDPLQATANGCFIPRVAAVDTAIGAVPFSGSIGPFISVANGTGLIGNPQPEFACEGAANLKFLRSEDVYF